MPRIVPKLQRVGWCALVFPMRAPGPFRARATGHRRAIGSTALASMHLAGGPVCRGVWSAVLPDTVTGEITPADIACLLLGGGPSVFMGRPARPMNDQQKAASLAAGQ